MCGSMITGRALSEGPHLGRAALQGCPYSEPSSFLSLLALGSACHM